MFVCALVHKLRLLSLICPFIMSISIYKIYLVSCYLVLWDRANDLHKLLGSNLSDTVF